MVPAWLLGGEVPVVPLVGASSVAQLDESLAAVDLDDPGRADWAMARHRPRTARTSNAF